MLIFWGKVGRNAEAMTLSKAAAELAIESSDFKSAAIAYQSIASNIVTTGKLKLSQVFAQRGVEFAKLSKSKLWHENLCATSAWIAFLMGDIATAEEAYAKLHLFSSWCWIWKILTCNRSDIEKSRLQNGIFKYARRKNGQNLSRTVKRCLAKSLF